MNNGDGNVKGFGWAVLIVGVIWAIVAINMDISVATGYGGRVTNIGLMSSRQNQVIISTFIMLCGILMVIFGKNKTAENGDRVKCPFCAEWIKAEALKCKHCGSDVSDALRTLREKAFRPIDMGFDEFFIHKNDGFEINLNSIATLANRMSESDRTALPMNIYDKFKGDIEELKNQLPSSIREDFEREVKKHF